MLYRITAYHKDLNISVIMDSTEKFKTLTDFEHYMVLNGFKIIESGTPNTFLDINIKPPKSFPNNIILRACHYGRPIETTVTQNGFTYRALQVNKKIYVPNKDRTV